MKKGVVITTDNKVYPVELSEPLFQGAKEILGGYMEHVWPGGLKRPYCLLCNEEGLLMGLPMNAYGSFLYRTQIHGSPIVGNIIIMKDGYENGEPSRRLRRAWPLSKVPLLFSSKCLFFSC